MQRKKTRRHARKQRRASVPSQALRFLERCELGLVAAYRSLPSDVLSPRETKRLATLHDGHALLLSTLADEAGERTRPYDLWITEPTISGMRFAEQTSYATYRDHLTTVAARTARMIRTRIMPDHFQAAEHLAELASRRGRTWRHPIHTRLPVEAPPTSAAGVRPYIQRKAGRAAIHDVGAPRRQARAMPRRRQAR